MKNKKANCPSCGREFENVDICESCENEFGDSGEDENGFNSTCVHCGNTTYHQACEKCREPLPVEMYE